MKKKVFLVLVLAAVAAGALGAQTAFSLSAGGGGFFGSDFGGGVDVSEYTSWQTPYAGGGVYAFLDAAYAELSYSLFFGRGTASYRDQEVSWFTIKSKIGLLGKYPFGINETLSLSPLLGIEFQFNEFHQDDTLWFKSGAGVDYSLTETIYLRFEALYGIRLATKSEKDNTIKGDTKGETRLGHGLTTNLGVGFRL